MGPHPLGPGGGGGRRPGRGGGAVRRLERRQPHGLSRRAAPVSPVGRAGGPVPLRGRGHVVALGRPAGRVGRAARDPGRAPRRPPEQGRGRTDRRRAGQPRAYGGGERRVRHVGDGARPEQAGMTSLEPVRLWRPVDLAAVAIGNAAGLAVILAAWAGAGHEVVTDRQIGWVDLGIAGLVIIAVANGGWLLAGRRACWRLRHSLLPAERGLPWPVSRVVAGAGAATLTTPRFV